MRIKLWRLWVPLLLIVVFVGLNADSAFAVGKEEEQGLSQKAVEIARVFGFPITNSMVVSWLVALGLIAFVQAATRKMKQDSLVKRVRGKS